MIILGIIIIYILINYLGSKDYNIQDYDYLIVLGHALNDNKMSFILKKRLDKALEYLNDNPNTKVIVSGGITNNNSISEAEVMKEYLLSNEISIDRILKEEESKDTIDNLKNIKKMINSEDKIIILSSDYHLLRIRILACILNLKIKVLACKSSIFEYLYHLFLELVFIIHNLNNISK